MVEITASLVKELRERTSAGILDCKKALTVSSGNIELAIKNMRTSGAIKAAKKIGNIVSEGMIQIKIESNYGVMIEVNCETDFVTKHSGFQLFVNRVINAAFIDKINDLMVLRSKFEEERIELISTIGENIHIRRIAVIEGPSLNSYLHHARIGVIVSTISSDTEFSKHIAMHIAASQPEYIRPEDISTEVIKNESQIQLGIAMQAGKSKDIAEKIIEGRMKKFADRISLTGQPFIFDQSKTVGQCLKEKNASVIDFVRFKIGNAIR
ncbi:translation elongation factor Ts [Candidatus Erwinia haradaeae]|uniref:Elongation factor Ts n=1 Tax=Candidatus Erwinia haradaeae TaxID=1922217 RepID=A0A803FTY1_9GAMM|nr:translation elongation factor Ts [Candidatus Erwinia haradaeae]VFP87622.1 Elongation factor Ts [Candidatus Erwinia haradaeae]